MYTKSESHMAAIYTSYTFAVIFITNSPWLKDESMPQLVLYKTMLNDPFNVSVLYTVNCFQYYYWVDTKLITIYVLLAFKYYATALLFLSVTLLMFPCLIMVECLQPVGILVCCSELLWGWK